MNYNNSEVETVMRKAQKILFIFRTHQKREIEEVAKKDNRTVSNFVNFAVKQFLERQEKR